MRFENNIPIAEGQQFYVTKSGRSFESVEGDSNASPIGFDELKSVIEELNDSDVEDDDISIFVLTNLKVRTKRTVEIIGG